MTHLISVWVLVTCVPEENKPCLPEVFGSYEAGLAAFAQRMREEWDAAQVHDEDGEESACPEDPTQAHEILAALNGPGWGRRELSHEWVQLDGPKPSLASTFLIANTAIRDEETGEALWWSNEDGWGSLSTASRFTAPEMATLPLPVDRAWVAQLDPGLTGQGAG